MKCAAIVIAHNNKNDLSKCMSSLLKSKIPVTTILVDNASTDGTINYIKKQFPSVILLKNQTNMGFAGGNNIGIKKALEIGCDSVFLLNADAWIEPNTIKTLVNFSKNHDEYGVLSPIHLSGDKKHFDRGFLRYFTEYSETQHAYEHLYLKIDQQKCYTSSFVNAAAWLVTKKCLQKVGGFDAKLFPIAYGEDDNYCQRLLYHGFKLGIVPTVTICHNRQNRPRRNPISPETRYKIFWHNILLQKRQLFKNLLSASITNKEIDFFHTAKFLLSNYHKINKTREAYKHPTNTRLSFQKMKADTQR
jgi:GT2 family glycosyltransferase